MKEERHRTNKLTLSPSLIPPIRAILLLVRIDVQNFRAGLDGTTPYLEAELCRQLGKEGEFVSFSLQPASLYSNFSSCMASQPG